MHTCSSTNKMTFLEVKLCTTQVGKKGSLPSLSLYIIIIGALHLHSTALWLFFINISINWPSAVTFF